MNENQQVPVQPMSPAQNEQGQIPAQDSHSTQPQQTAQQQYTQMPGQAPRPQGAEAQAQQQFAQQQPMQAAPTPLQYAQVPQQPAKPVYLQPAPIPMTKKDRNLRLGALIMIILNLLATVINCFSIGIETYLDVPSESTAFVIVLGICIFMMLLFAYRTFLMIRVNEIYKGIYPNSTGFAILVLLTGELLGGIFLLCSKKDKM